MRLRVGGGSREDTVRDQNALDSFLTEGDPSETTDNAADAPSGGWTKGWGRVFRGNRALWLTVVVAALCLVAGLGLGRFVLSPADAAANSAVPDPGFITIPVNYGVLSNDVTLRGQVGYADSTDVTLTPSDAGGSPVVTGHLPEVGSQLKLGSIAIEVAGRPVFVLPGALPAYRTLRFGMTGPDVAQLKKALKANHINAGGGDTFDTALANAIRTLYRDAGYEAPVDSTAKDAVRTAQDAVQQADQSVDQARADLHTASTGATRATRREWDNNVARAQRELNAALAAQPQDKDAVANAKDALALAKLQRTEALKRPDTTTQRTALRSAQQRRADAGKQLKTAQQGALPIMPASEVLYLTSLPRRVDAVNVKRGTVVDGPVMSVSGATTELAGSASPSDAKLLKVGGEAFFDLPSGDQHRAVIAKIKTESTGSRATVTFTPDPLTTEQIQQLQGTNVRVRVPVGATDGKVLSVPFAALTAGPGGESRVEVVEGDPRDGDRGKTRLVKVKTGLAAQGYVEVTPTDGTLKEGDLVVVGK